MKHFTRQGLKLAVGEDRHGHQQLSLALLNPAADQGISAEGSPTSAELEAGVR